MEIIEVVVAVIGALAAVGGVIGVGLKIHKWFLEQEEQSQQIAELKTHHEADVNKIKEEDCLICYALSSCLDGLQQLGANHTVPIAKDKLDKYLNKAAHDLETN